MARPLAAPLLCPPDCIAQGFSRWIVGASALFLSCFPAKWIYLSTKSAAPLEFRGNTCHGPAMKAALPPPPLPLPTGAAFLLDFDGTLVELAETPDSIRVWPELPSLLRRLSEQLAGRVAIVSGRAL